MSDPSAEDIYLTPEKHVERAEDYITAADELEDSPASVFRQYCRLAEMHLRAAEVKHALREWLDGPARWREIGHTEPPEERTPVGTGTVFVAEQRPALVADPSGLPLDKLGPGEYRVPGGATVGGVRLPEHASAYAYGDPVNVTLTCHKSEAHRVPAPCLFAVQDARHGDDRIALWAAEHAHEGMLAAEPEQPDGDAHESADGLPRCTAAAWTLDGERRCLLDAGHSERHIAVNANNRPVRW